MKTILTLTAGIIAILATYETEANSLFRTTDKADICSTKTSAIRNVSAKTKALVYQRDGVPGGNYTGKCRGLHGCKVDHRMSLNNGGSNAMDNLIIQLVDGPCNAKHKDTLEQRLHTMICKKDFPVIEAQDILYNDWVSGYVKYVDSKGCL
jgi:5-methylcytosine-specific restriction endonuclease McrA